MLHDTADAAMHEMQRIKAARKSALVDCSLQLRLKAGQVEVRLQCLCTLCC